MMGGRYAISQIPTREMRRCAIEEQPFCVCRIQNPTEEDYLNAIRGDSCVLQLVPRERRTQEILNCAVRERFYAFEYLNNDERNSITFDVIKSSKYFDLYNFVIGFSSQEEYLEYYSRTSGIQHALVEMYIFDHVHVNSTHK